MLRLNNLSSPKGATKNTKRIGRGQGSGQGTQAGKGHKGQKARSGGGIPLGFEGGQMPLYRRLPKRGFSNYLFRKHFAIVNLAQLADFSGEVTRESLISAGLIAGGKKKLPIKILAKEGDKLQKSLTFTGIEKFSKAAKGLIEKSGGKIQ